MAQSEANTREWFSVNPNLEGWHWEASSLVLTNYHSIKKPLFLSVFQTSRLQQPCFPVITLVLTILLSRRIPRYISATWDISLAAFCRSRSGTTSPALVLAPKSRLRSSQILPVSPGSSHVAMSPYRFSTRRGFKAMSMQPTASRVLDHYLPPRLYCVVPGRAVSEHATTRYPCHVPLGRLTQADLMAGLTT